jgi:hypothetical protein
MIIKLDLRLSERDGQEGISTFKKLTKKQIEEIKSKKSEIILELKSIKAAEEAKKEADRKAAAEELEKFKNNTKQIEVNFHDGEYLSGYGIYGQAAKLLEELGLAKYISGWGYHVNSNFIETVGEKFTYQQAINFSQPARDAKAADQAKKEVEKQAKFDKARNLGNPVVLYQYATWCNDRREECSTDIVTVWAMPDGSTKTERKHTW